MTDDDEMRMLREACGFVDPVVQQEAPPSNIDHAIEKAEAVWDYMLARSGTIPDILGGDK